jgi:predicted ATP-dependent serine protease
MLKSGYTNPVVSVPSGTISKKFWENCKDWLDSFEQIVLSFDNDDVGKALTEKFADVFPDKVFVVNHGNFKDANDFLTAGKQKEFVSAWWNKRKYSPAGFTSSPEDWMKIVDEENPYEYVPTPIVGLNDKIRGWVKGGLTILKAPPGVGKSSIFRMAQHDLVVNKKKVVAVLHMEEQKSTTARGLATYELGRNVNTKEDAENNGISEDEVKEALMRVVGEGNFISFEIDPHNAMESTLRQCNQAISVYDADFIFIDHFQRLAYLSGVDGATASLTELGVKLVELSKRKNVGIIGISHVNSDGHTKYAKSIEEEAIILIEFERDKLAEDADTRNTAYCTVTKNRPFALTGAAGALQYDNETTLVKEKGYT